MSKSKSRGFTLIELICVIGVIAVILLFSIRQYLQAQQHMQVVGIKSDVQTIKRALDNYFQLTGCNQEGTFSKLLAGGTQFQPDIVSDLGLSTTYLQRSPLVRSYRTVIIDSGQKTIKDNKPLYFLQLQAELIVDAAQIAWYVQQLDAGGSNGNIIYWQSLSNTSYVQAHKQLWVLDASREQFLQAENILDPDRSPQISGSYCAN